MITWELATLPPGLRGQHGYSARVGLVSPDGVEERELVWRSHPENRGIFAVEVYELIEWDANDKAWIASPIPQETAVEFYTEPNSVVEGLVTELTRSDQLARARLIGRVSIRLEILWAFLAVAGIGLLWICARLLILLRSNRRYRQNHCTRCCYPLPMEDEPVCPECGTRHVP